MARGWKMREVNFTIGPLTTGNTTSSQTASARYFGLLRGAHLNYTTLVGISPSITVKTSRGLDILTSQGTTGNSFATTAAGARDLATSFCGQAVYGTLTLAVASATSGDTGTLTLYIEEPRSFPS